MESRKLTPTLKWLFKLTISAIALYVVFLKIDINQVLKLVKNLRVLPVIIALVLFNFSQIVSAFRYRDYLKILNIQLNPLRNIKLYYVGMFYNLFLPGGIGGDGYKVWLLKKEFSTSWRALITVSFLERLNGLAALMTLALVIMVFLPLEETFAVPSLIAFLLAGLMFPVLYLVVRLTDKKYTKYFITISGQSLLIQILQLISGYFILVSLGLADSFGVYLFLFLIGLRYEFL